MDEEFGRQRPLFTYGPSLSVNGSERSGDGTGVDEEDDALSAISSSNDSLNYGPALSWYEVTKNSKLKKPVIPSWDVVPRVSSINKEIAQKKAVSRANFEERADVEKMRKNKFSPTRHINVSAVLSNLVTRRKMRKICSHWFDVDNDRQMVLFMVTTFQTM